MEEWSLAKSSLPGIGRDKSWKVSTVVETCHTFRELAQQHYLISKSFKQYALSNMFSKSELTKV